jgi:hypothetical protein
MEAREDRATRANQILDMEPSGRIILDGRMEEFNREGLEWVKE